MDMVKSTFLIDTNVLIPLEPTSPSDVETSTRGAADFVGLCLSVGAAIYRHPLTSVDLARDRDAQRQAMRRQLIGKYPELPDPPPVTGDIDVVLGAAPQGSNDWVDHHLLAALKANAVDFLVSEDIALHQKAKRLGLKSRTLLVSEAAAALRALFDRAVIPPPAVVSRKCHALDIQDPIFDTLKSDYEGFVPWFERCRLAHRQAWVIYGEDRLRLAAVAVVKQDDELGAKVGLFGKCLKLCCFKVSDLYRGRRYGELLLKTVLMHAHENHYGGIAVTAFGRYEYLIDFLQDFGFWDTGVVGDHGDTVFAKRLAPPPSGLQSGIGAWDFHREYGPFRMRLDGTPLFLVPIQPRYHAMLFPEAERQRTLFEGRVACGNSIKKAYLCHAAVRRLRPGDNLVFYQSAPAYAISCTGVVEDTLVSVSAAEIVRFVGKRTVYSRADIERMAGKTVLVILFRQSVTLAKPATYDELLACQILRGPPQTIVELPEGAKQWTKERIAQ